MTISQYFQEKDVAITCIYCNYKEQAKQTVLELVASLLKQLVQDHPMISAQVKSLYDRHFVRGTHPAHDEFTKALRAEIARYSKIFIVVDALDELAERDQGYLITELRSLANVVNLMVTSRPLPSIERFFQDTKRVDILANERDVRTYIQVRTLREPRLLLHVEGQQMLRESMVIKIIANVQGMCAFPIIIVLPSHTIHIFSRFLLAKLHMDSLATKLDRRAVRNALDTLPTEVNSIYTEAMGRISGQIECDRELAKRVLTWVTYTRQPLSLTELQHEIGRAHV